MVTWILGRSGTGKTTLLLNKLPALAGEYEQVYFLVPEQSSMMLEREISRRKTQGVQVVSFRRLSNVIFRQFGGIAGSYLSQTKETALIYRILQEQQGALRYYAKARPTMGFVNRLAEAFSEFTLSGLRKETVLPLLEKNGRQDWLEKYRDLFMLYEAYQGALGAECRSMAADLTAATALAREKGFFARSAVVLDGFFGFTGQQREMLQVILEQSGCVYCAFLNDPQEESLLFSTAQQELERLEKLARACGQECRRLLLAGPSMRLANRDLLFLEQNLFSLHAGAPEEPVAHLQLLEGKNIREELAMVAVDIEKKVREQGWRYRDVALIAGSLDVYGPVAETVFAKYGVPLFIDQGKQSLSKPLFAFVQSALRLISPERYFRQEDMLAFLKTGLCGVEMDWISRLENYCIRWQINGKRWIREENWTQNPKGLGKPDEEALLELEKLNTLRLKLRAPLLRFQQRAEEGSGEALAEAIYGLLCDFQVEKQLAEQAEAFSRMAGQSAWETQQARRSGREYLKLYRVMIDILDDIYQIFGKQKISLYAMEELIGLCGEEVKLNLVPPTMDAVTFGAVAHSRLSEVRGLYVVGANQGILPMPVADQGLIGDRERRFFSANDLSCNATLQQNTLQGQYRFYAALFSAREEIAFAYSAFQMDGTAQTPSVYVDRLRRLTGLRPRTREKMDVYDFAVTRSGARELITWVPSFQKPVLDALGERPLPRQKPDERLPEEVVKRVFGNRLKLSYSQISLYQNCPFHYFLEKTLKIRPLEPVTFDAANIGTFIHYGMEQLIKAVRADNFDYNLYTSEKIQQFGSTLARQYLEDQLRDFNLSNRFSALFERMTRLFCLVGENVIGELREGQYRPVGEEVSLAGVSLPLSKGRQVELIGSIDRVDVLETGGKSYLKVTDYKTGAQSFDLRGITNRDGVQLPLYLYALVKSGRWKQPVPAAGCYMEAHLPSFSEPVTPEQLPEKIRSFYRRGGAFTQDETALAGLDANRGGNYFKLAYTKDGALKKEVKAYEPPLLNEMIGYMETVVCETAEGIFSGEAAVRPLKGRDHDACRFCRYAAVCHYDQEQDEKRLYREEPFGWREEKKQ
ncbi:MAG: hypothetical protein DBX52_05970 [Clostridiales bacterium]|nr:MAG: hypothetical protein DBX52_05970 [Clostridiales bacterium]